MLEHLLDADPTLYIPPLVPNAKKGLTPIEKVTPADEIDAKLHTAEMLDEIGLLPDDLVTSESQSQTAREAFMAMTATFDKNDQKQALARVDTPAAVRELVGMLTAYDWQFVEQAKELRGYVVAKITEETTHPDARIRLKALELLGKVTEVALFTERMEVKQTGLTDSELDEELKKRLDQYAHIEKEVQDSVVAVISQKTDGET